MLGITRERISSSMRKQLLLFILCIYPIKIIAYSISPEPILVYSIPNSIKDSLSPLWLQYVGKRTRFSTCTGIAFLPNGRHLVSINLLDESMRIHDFDPAMKTLSSNTLHLSTTTQLAWPENIDISKDGSLLAISNSKTGKVAIFLISSKTQQPDPSPVVFIGAANDRGLHGVRFTPDSQHIAYTTYDGSGIISCFRIEKDSSNQISSQLLWSMKNEYPDLVPKGIDFSHDKQYLAVCFAKKVRYEEGITSGKLAIYKLDPETCTINQTALCFTDGDGVLDGPEDIRFSPDNSCLLVSNQGNDTITVHQFDQASGAILSNQVLLSSPEAQLNFPHGIVFSPDGNYFGVSNYGDDKITIYSVE